MPRYVADDFASVPHAADVYFCPGCNASADDSDMLSVRCPCATHASAGGSLNAKQVAAYLRDVER